MKNLVLLLVAITCPLFLSAQKITLTNPDVIIGYKTNTSLPFDQLNDDRSIWPRTRALKDGYTPKKDWVLHKSIDHTAKMIGPDPVWQQEYVPSAAKVNKRGIDNNWDGAGFTGVNPADPSLDVGPNHVVQMINNSSSSIVRVWGKSGTQLSSVLLSSITGVAGAGDPIVIYDQLADQWLISEFADNGNVLVVAMSTGPDPTGSYMTYQFTTPSFPDYPKYSIWPDAYYVTTNEGDGYAYALERDSMLAGAASAQMHSFPFANFPTLSGFQTPTPTSLSGTTLPPAGTPQYIMRIADAEWTTTTTDVDRLEVYEFVPDWTNTANSTISGPTDFNTAMFDTDLCGYTSFSCMDQPGTTTQLDPLREVLMNRIYYRNFGSHESIVCNHVTDVDNTDRGGVRWYELQRSGGAWSIYQQGTYSPDADDRWMAGIAINAYGSIGLAYNVSSTTTFPSIRYTGRLASDPLGMMTIAETDLATGAASNSSNRWGDYNCLAIDPANDYSFWFTGKYNTTSNWKTRVSEFSFGPLAPAISFQSASSTETESTDVVTGCLGYKDFTLNMQISTAPTMPADITITSTGTATEGTMQDVEISPKTFTLDNSNLSQAINLRIYDDRSIEAVETLVLNYMLDANGGDAIAGPLAQSFTLTINDNDVIPSGMMAEMYNEDFDPAPTDITITDGGTTADTWEFIVDMGGDDLDGTPFVFVDSDAAGSGEVLNEIMDFPVVPLVPGQTAMLTFDEYYRAWNDNTELGYVDVFDGTNWQRILMHESAGGDIGDWSAPNAVNLDITAYANPNFQVRIGYEAEFDYWWAIDNVVISQVSIAEIATAVTAVNDTFYFGPNAMVLAVDENEKIIARIDNLTGHDFGCATLAVDRAGNSATVLPDESDPARGFTDKTYFLSFLDGAQTGNAYQLTLYYDDTEKQGWESATGHLWTDTSTVISRFDQSVTTSTTSSTSEIGLTTMKNTEFSSNSISAIFSNGPGGLAVSNQDISTGCMAYLFINGNPLSGSYLAQDSIDSDALISGNKTIVYSAGINVELQQNFQVDTGSDFTAMIGGCSISSMSILASKNKIPYVFDVIQTNSRRSVQPAIKPRHSPNDVKLTKKGQTIIVENLSTTNHMSPKAIVSFRKKGEIVHQITAKMKPVSNGTYSLFFELDQAIDMHDTSFKIETQGYQFYVK